MTDAEKTPKRTTPVNPDAADPAPPDDSVHEHASQSLPKSAASSSAYRERVFQIVRRIPAGRVMTYGQIAEILGAGYDARTVGYCMHAADDTVPWQRVINAQGACSTGRVLLPVNKQQLLLEAEGIHFNSRARCDLAQYRWTPPEADAETTGETSMPTLF